MGKVCLKGKSGANPMPIHQKKVQTTEHKAKNISEISFYFQAKIDNLLTSKKGKCSYILKFLRGIVRIYDKFIDSYLTAFVLQLILRRISPLRPIFRSDSSPGKILSIFHMRESGQNLPKSAKWKNLKLVYLFQNKEFNALIRHKNMKN